MTTLQITLPPELAARLDERIASGAAEDAVAVVRDGLAALEAEDARRLAAIRAKVERAMSDPRPSSEAADVFARVERALASRLMRHE